MKRKTGLLITIIFAVAVLPLSFVAYKEFYVKPFLASEPAYLRPYVDYEPFFSTGYGTATIIMWTVLIFLWGFEGARLFKRRLNQKKGHSFKGRKRTERKEE